MPSNSIAFNVAAVIMAVLYALAWIAFYFAIAVIAGSAMIWVYQQLFINGLLL